MNRFRYLTLMLLACFGPVAISCETTQEGREDDQDTQQAPQSDKDQSSTYTISPFTPSADFPGAGLEWESFTNGTCVCFMA